MRRFPGMMGVALAVVVGFAAVGRPVEAGWGKPRGGNQPSSRPQGGVIGQAIRIAPRIPGVPGLPGLSSIPGMPHIPGVPGLPGVGSLPGLIGKLR